MKIPAGRRRYVWDERTQSCVEQNEIKSEKNYEWPNFQISLRPKETIQKVLISTTSRLAGEYEKNGILLTHAWPDFHDQSPLIRQSPGPISRSAFMLTFVTEPFPKSGILPDYSPTGHMICSYLAVLFGKRFDNHGFIEEQGTFHIPDLAQFGYLCDPLLPQNSHQLRIDFPVPLNLSEIHRIEPLIFDKALDPNFRRSFGGAAKFYLQAMQNVEHDSEIAYLDLIAAGEILSGFYDYEKDELMDDNIKQVLSKIREEMNDGTKIAKQLSDRMFQVKRRFVESIIRLIDEKFLGSTERQTIGGFKSDSFRSSISAAYDLRSRYVHTGISFGPWVSLKVGGRLNEIQLGSPMMEDKEFGKILRKAPTYIGLERVIRYCLLQSAKEQGACLDPGITT
jgi:hypothetical protein